MAEERLQKVMAAAGVGSRRSCEAMITAGRVKVNGVVVTELGTKVDPSLVQITVDGKPFHAPSRHLYLKVNKPRGILSDIGGDTHGRETVATLANLHGRRVFPVGRLDLLSEGLVLLTDDGELAHRLTHPRYEHPKTYYVLVGARPDDEALERLRQGVEIEGEKTAPAEVRVVGGLPPTLQLELGPRQGVWLEIILREGKKRQIRHMTAAVGHPTLRLIRWAIGPLKLGEVDPGRSAPLTRQELAALQQSVESGAARPRRTSTPRGQSTTSRGAPGARPPRPGTTAKRGPRPGPPSAKRPPNARPRGNR